MLDFVNVPPGVKVLELGGGDNPHPIAQVNVDVRSGPRVHFVADFNEPLPIATDEWDLVICQYTLEHISYRKVPQFVSEMLRIIRPGARAVVVTSNTDAQIRWMMEHPKGWDGKDFFESASCVLFGDQDYPENSHKCYFDKEILLHLFAKAGFTNITVQEYGERNTDLVVMAFKPEVVPNVLGTNVVRAVNEKPPEPGVVFPENAGQPVASPTLEIPRNLLFDKHYFNGGGKVGGYAYEGYWDYPVHEITALHVFKRKPESVLELGCARGYILKRIQDQGVWAEGLEISKHCYLTRVADGIRNVDLCRTPWDFGGRFSGIQEFDLCFSIATLEHIPEEFVPEVIREMARTCKRGLHGIDFGQKDDGFDKTHCTLRPKTWWEQQFVTHAPGWPVEIVDKEELETAWAPNLANNWLIGDGKVKINVGCFRTMFHRGWINIDILDVKQFAAQYGYQFVQHDVRHGLPFQTGVVDLIYSSHFLEHLSYKDGLSFLRECRRVIKPTGAMRIMVPDAKLLMEKYLHDESAILKYPDQYKLAEYDEINDGCAAAPTPAGKLWALLHEGHSACYDGETLINLLKDAGFTARKAVFRNISNPNSLLKDWYATEQILRETLDVFPCLSLYVDALPQ